METVTKEFEIEIGKIRYTFDIDFHYNPGTSQIDPSEGEYAELDCWSFDGVIYAEDSDTDWIVSDKAEIQKIRESIDIYSLFNEALS